jgi:alkylation response protein AidB-like acyl-CoA dehydrogenase
MVADLGMQVEAARSLVYRAACAVEAEEPGFSALSAMAKCFATDTAMRVTTDCLQLMGGYGYMKEYPMERMMRDAKITQIYEGTNQVQRVVISRALLGK